MKIVQVCSGLARINGGAERHCVELSRQLCSQGHSVTLVVGENEESIFRDQLIKVEIIPKVHTKVFRKIFFDYINPAALYRYSMLLSQLQPDVVHLHSLYGISSSLVWASARRAPTSVTFHDMWPVYYDPPPRTPIANLANNWWKVPFGWAHRNVNRELFRKAHIISPSKWLIEYSRKVGIKSVMTHIPPAVKLGQDKKRYEKEIIWVGRIEEPKGLAEVLSTLVDCGRLHQWKVTIVGDGPDRKILEKKYPYAEFTGAVDPLKYYQRASILVVSSIQPETGPLVLLEGMAYGLCVIGYGIGGVPEIVCDNSDGILYLSREDLAEKLSNLVVDRSRIEEVGRLAVKKVERCYGWDKCVERHLNVYRAGIGNLIT